MHNNIDVVKGHAKQFVRFNDFKTFVHECGGINSDLWSHLPRGMTECLINSDFF